MSRPAKATTALAPAASRAPETLTAEETLLNGEAIETFAKAVGGRQQLAEILSVAGTSPEADKISRYLLDPRYKDVSLRRLCGYLGITVADLFAAYRKAAIARSHIESSVIVAGKLPPIVTDVMDRALSDPTVERQKLALELGQLIEKKGGIVMQQNTIAGSSFAAVGGTGSLEQLHQAVGDLLFNPARRRGQHPPPPEIIDIDPPAELPDPRVPQEEEPELPFEDPPLPDHPAHLEGSGCITPT